MKSLKGLDWPERQRRHKLILQVFEAQEPSDLPWMSRVSANDPEVVMEITNRIGEPVGVYSYFRPGDWFSVSVNQVSQSVGGAYSFLEFGKGQIRDIQAEADSLRISGSSFRVPAALAGIYSGLIRMIEESIG